MRLTPIEIRRHRFSSRVRGFDRDEVRTFLDMVISDFEDVVRENAELRRDTERMVRELRNYQASLSKRYACLVLPLNQRI